MPDPTAVPSEGGALAEAERFLRDRIEEMARHDDATNDAIAVVLAECDRRGLELAEDVGVMNALRRHRDEARAALARCRKVVQAATALAAQWESMRRCYQSVEESNQLGDLLDALAAEVAALSEEQS